VKLTGLQLQDHACGRDVQRKSGPTAILLQESKVFQYSIPKGLENIGTDNPASTSLANHLRDHKADRAVPGFLPRIRGLPGE
jgi:hypothetical protein